MFQVCAVKTVLIHTW